MSVVDGPMPQGFARGDGRSGVRNHVLVLPSVVCSTHAAGEIARGRPAARAIVHQHGCLHVGDDLRHTEGALIGVATNPNVGAVVVVSLGCETIQGRRLARRIAALGQRVRLVGIQAAGGTERAVAEGGAAVDELAATLAQERREPIPPGGLVVGVDDEHDPLTGALRAAFERRGWQTVVADGERGAEAHVTLAGLGAQAIVSLRGAHEGATGFAVCPVVAVARDEAMHRALHDDFDALVGTSDDEAAAAERLAQLVLATCAGEPTASERRGASDFVLHRLAMTM